MTSKKNNEHTEPENKTNSSESSPEASSNALNYDKKSIANSPSTPVQQDKKKKKTPELEEKQGKRGVKLGAIAIVISIVFSGGLAFQMQQENSLQQDQIKALQNQILQYQSTTSQELQSVKQETIQKATTATEKAQVVLSQQQKSIESLQLAVADVKGRRPNDWLLAEADYLVKLAGRKLFLEHDAASATLLMESADQRIAALNDPSLVPLRQAMANDITKLRIIPIIDKDGLVLRLTSLQQQVDSLPLANAILPDAPEEKQEAVSQDINEWQHNLMTSLSDFSESFITFRTRDGSAIPLLSPQQHFYLRENIKAKLETAIKAVYLEQSEIYSTSLTVANEWSATYLNQGDNAVIKFNQTLQQLSQQNIAVEYPIKLTTQNILSDVIRERLRREVTTMTVEDK